MNIDRNLVARALAKAGEEPITDEEWTDGTSNRVRIVKEFYLALLLEALASYDWTSQKKRERLITYYEYEEVLEPVQDDLAKYYIIDDDGKYVKAESFDESETYYILLETNLTNYFYMYPLPADCAKVVKLEHDSPYIVEGAFLYSDEEDAILLYINNYWTGQYLYEVEENPDTSDITKYYVKDTDGNYIPATVYVEGTTYYSRVEEDYPFYSQPKLDPTLSAYFECKLASTIALKLTGAMDKYQVLYNEAQLIADNAQKKSAEMAQNRTKGNPWWTSQLGLD